MDVDAKRGRRANFGAEESGRIGRRQGLDSRASGSVRRCRDFAADGAGGREPRRRRASEAACAAGRHRHFGAEDGVRPATAGPDGGEAACAAGGRRRIHAGEAARGRPPIPAAVKRQVWARDQGCCYVDRRSGRRCGSRYLLQVDHVFPYALGGNAEPDNLRLLCAAHHRYRHRHAGRHAARRNE